MAQVATSNYKVINKLCASEVMKSTKLKNLQRQKKLCLILDLDHTLVHTIYLNRGDHFRSPATSLDIFQRKLTGVNHIIKLRPFVRNFLKEASKLFEMYIYTLGTRDYALEVANILDPQSVYFGSRIISSEDSTKKYEKSLDVLPDVDESVVLILDDLEAVWSKYPRNLILMKKYVYFASRVPVNKTIKVFRDESGGSGALIFVLKVLQVVHDLYFKRNNLSEHCDVRDLLVNVHKMIYRRDGPGLYALDIYLLCFVYSDAYRFRFSDIMPFLSFNYVWDEDN